MPQKLFLAAGPGQTTAAGRWGLPLAHLCYRVGEGFHLFRANSPAAPQGGVMVIDGGRPGGEGEAEPFCGEVMRECALRRFSGVYCRFAGRPTPLVTEAVSRLAGLCRGRGMGCWASEGCAPGTGAGVVVSTALSGGTLRGRLEDVHSRYGDRGAIWLERTAEDFLLPSPSGAGAPLTPEELERRRADSGSGVFFSPELCAHYFTYMAGEVGHFVLFDDAASLRRKLELARSLDIQTVFLPYGQVADCLEALVPGR